MKTPFQWPNVFLTILLSPDFARPVAWLVVTAGSVWLIRHFGFLGVMASVLVGWGILYFAYHSFPVPTGQWDEDREEIHYSAPILLITWCFPIWSFMAVIRGFKRR